MLENTIIGLTIAFWIAGVFALIFAKLIHERFIKWVNPGSHALRLESWDEVPSDFIPSTDFPDFVPVPQSRRSVSNAGTAKELEVVTQSH